MNVPAPGLYRGDVVHTRVRPVSHKLRYHVFALLVDCEGIDGLNRRLRLFSRNRFNLVSLHDRDHGDGAALGPYLRRLAQDAGLGATITRFMMLCYPRIAGYAFNPLTVYYGLDEQGRVRLAVYEVNNTFGQRQTYALPVDMADESGLIAQSCDKALYVSPFNTASGVYSFRLTPPGEHLVIGVALRDPAGPVLTAHFSGRKEELSDANLLRALAATGWMTVKVMTAIHWEALKLWLKGLRPQPRPAAPARAVFVARTREETSSS
ncbi:MAG: DUF1365 domain-containing protein [Pseudomonadota bacterium]|nr:DUF1365 domain-containing protein [Pseudomonadota bacterium]